MGGYLLRIFYVWYGNRFPKLITKKIFKSKYNQIQQFHLENFKKKINEDLKSAIKNGYVFPIYIDYSPKILSEEYINKLKDYIMFTLDFGYFEIDQTDCIHKLILKG